MLIVAVATCAALTVTTAWAHEHDEDFEIGQNPSTGQIAVHYDPDLYPFTLPVSAEPELPGFALDDPGFVSLDGIEDPGEFEPLDPSAVIALQVLSTSPAFKVWHPLAPGELEIAGSTLLNFGSTPIHVHTWWHIDNTDPAYDPLAGPWAVTFQLIDTAGAYAASDPITVTFTPEPSTLGLLACGAVVLLRRRV